MTVETIRLLRDIFLRTFWVGFAVYLLSWLAMMGAWNTWIDLASRWTHLDAASLIPLVINSFITIKCFIIFGLLVPALGLHWTLKAERKKQGV